MATYIQYELEDGSSVIIEGDEKTTGLTRASGKDSKSPIPAKKKFEEALSAIKPWTSALRRQLNDLKADEVSVTFGLKTGGEAGNLCVPI